MWWDKLAQDHLFWGLASASVVLFAFTMMYFIRHGLNVAKDARKKEKEQKELEKKEKIAREFIGKLDHLLDRNSGSGFYGVLKLLNKMDEETENYLIDLRLQIIQLGKNALISAYHHIPNVLERLQKFVHIIADIDNSQLKQETPFTKLAKSYNEIVDQIKSDSSISQDYMRIRKIQFGEKTSQK